MPVGDDSWDNESNGTAAIADPLPVQSAMSAIQNKIMQLIVTE